MARMMAAMSKVVSVIKRPSIILLRRGRGRGLERGGGEALHRGDLTHLDPHGARRRAQHIGPRLDIAHHARLRADPRPITNMQMPGNANLAPHLHPVAQHGRA